MSDIFGIAKSGLQAYKEGLATTGQNIANVGNENYARREVNLTEVKSPTSDVLSISSNKNYGAKVLVLDEPTSALGVHQASVVLKYIVKAASQGLAVILITHNVHHAYPVGNSFTVLNRGKSLGTYEKKDISREKLLSMMAGGEELDKLEVELKEMNRISS